jgi:murein DD-endopeptidase MepM/ murein hydrolase activator NlpD
MEPIGDQDWSVIQLATGLRPAEAWANSVAARAQAFVTQFESAEPDLTRLAGNLEELRALQAALPSRWPASGDITSSFGWRHNPMGGRGWDHHSGVDVSNKTGTPIYAPAAGKIVRASYNAGYGRMIEIDHGFGITTIYGHCHRFRTREGVLVQQGDLIGLMGSTGRSTGPHLHYEVRIDGHAVDPVDYIQEP